MCEVAERVDETHADLTLHRKNGALHVGPPYDGDFVLHLPGTYGKGTHARVDSKPHAFTHTQFVPIKRNKKPQDSNSHAHPHTARTAETPPGNLFDHVGSDVYLLSHGTGHGWRAFLASPHAFYVKRHRVCFLRCLLPSTRAHTLIKTNVRSLRSPRF